jgi:hypothetical protein
MFSRFIACKDTESRMQNQSKSRRQNWDLLLLPGWILLFSLFGFDERWKHSKRNPEDKGVQERQSPWWMAETGQAAREEEALANRGEEKAKYLTDLARKAEAACACQWRAPCTPFPVYCKWSTPRTLEDVMIGAGLLAS